MFAFPREINEKAARVVAGAVAATGVLVLVTGWYALLAVLAYGFWARVASGPRFSPLALLATRAIAPRLGEPKLVPGPPKRFAQAMGAAMTTAGALLALLGAPTAAAVLTGMLVVAAGLEAVFALCLGCKVFAGLMRLGVVPEEVCVQCADLSLRRA